MQILILTIVALFCFSDAAVPKHKLPFQFHHVVRFQRSLQMVGEELAKHSHTREKRDLSSVLALHCIQGCVRTMHDDLSTIGLSPDNNNGGLLNPQLYQGGTFQGYCDAGLEAKDCIDQCTTGNGQSSLMASVKDSMNTAFQAFVFLCVDHKDEFLSYLSCYRRSEDSVKETCTPKCGDAQELAQRSQSEIRSAATQGNLKKISKIMENLCVFLRCTMKCEATIITDVCETRQPAALLYDFARSSVESVQKLLEKVPGVGALWPPTCQKIANEEPLTDQIAEVKNNQIATENDSAEDSKIEESNAQQENEETYVL